MKSDVTVVSIAAVFFNSCSYYNRYTWSKKHYTDSEVKLYPTNTPRGLYVETTWKRSFPCRFNVESTWCVCRAFSGMYSCNFEAIN